MRLFCVGHLKLSLLFSALFFSIVMLRYEASQALQIEMLLPIAIGISMTKATILNAPILYTGCR